MIQLYGFGASRAFRILWLLEELEMDYQFKALDFSKGEQRDPKYLALNPAGKIPTIVDGDLVLWESGAIATYLSEKYSNDTFIPKWNTPERALFFQWLFFITTELEQGLWTRAKHTFALPPEKRIPDVCKVAEYEFAKASAILSKALEGKEYLVADRFTAVDIFAAHTLSWAIKHKVPLDSKVLENYLNLQKQRPAYKRVLEKHF